MQKVLLNAMPYPHRVDAEIRGPFAIHEGLEKQEYVATHLFTGLYILPRDGQPDSLTYAEAIRQADELAALSCNWYFSLADEESFAEVKREFAAWYRSRLAAPTQAQAREAE